MNIDQLRNQSCQPRSGSGDALHRDDSDKLLALLPDWRADESRSEIVRELAFDDFHKTMAFVNALAWIAHQQDHHPDLEVGYNRCRVRFSTHDVGGLSLNDFICAARTDALLAG